MAAATTSWHVRDGLCPGWLAGWLLAGRSELARRQAAACRRQPAASSSGYLRQGSSLGKEWARPDLWLAIFLSHSL